MTGSQGSSPRDFSRLHHQQVEVKLELDTVLTVLLPQPCTTGFLQVACPAAGKSPALRCDPRPCQAPACLPACLTPFSPLFPGGLGWGVWGVTSGILFLGGREGSQVTTGWGLGLPLVVTFRKGAGLQRVNWHRQATAVASGRGQVSIQRPPSSLPARPALGIPSPLASPTRPPPPTPPLCSSAGLLRLSSPEWPKTSLSSSSGVEAGD